MLFYMKLYVIYGGLKKKNREELRGVSRGKNAKDVDWSEVAATFDDIEPVSLFFFFVKIISINEI